MAVSQFYKDNSESKQITINNVPLSVSVTTTPVETLFENKVLDNSVCFSGNQTKYFTDVWYGNKFKINVDKTSPNITLSIDSEHEMFRQQSSKMILTYNDVPQFKPTATNIVELTDNRNIYNNTSGETVHSMFPDVTTKIVTDFDLNRVVLALFKGNNLWNNDKPTITTLDQGLDYGKQNHAYIKLYYRTDNYTLSDITQYFSISELIQTDTDLILNQITNTNLLFNSRDTSGLLPFKTFPSIPVHGTGNTISKIDEKYLAHTSDFSVITTESGTNFQYVNGDEDNTGITCTTYWSGGNICKYMTTAFNIQLKKILASFGLRFIYCHPSAITDKASYDANIKLAYMDENGFVNPEQILNGTDEINTSDTHNKDIDYNVMPLIPDTPSPYPKKDDKIDAPNYRVTNEIGGFTRYYKVTRTQLANIITNINTATDIPDGYEFLPHVVSVRQYPFNISQYASGHDENITIGGYDTRVSGVNLDSTQLAVQNIATIPIPRKFNNFLDKAPFTQLSLYIPCCGWIDLPDIVVGHTITVDIAHDVINGACIGIVKLKGMPIVQSSGVMGNNISISAAEVGLKNASLTQAAFNVGGGVLTTGYALSTGNPVGAVSGIMSTLASVTQGNIANNSNYTHQIGATQSKANDHISNTCYLRISFPVIELPDNFSHTCGYICNQNHKISECSGFTRCENVDTSGLTCTQTEKDMIKDILERGFYK